MPPRVRHGAAGAAALVLFGAAAAATPVAGQSLFACQDTRYSTGRPADAFTSRGHLVQLFGDASARSTNWFEDEYDGYVTSTTARLFAPRLSELVPAPVPLPDPFGFAVFSRLTEIDWEDRVDYGVGLEWRPFKHARLESLLGRWLYHLRAYATYHETSFLQYEAGWDWRPDSDFRAGVELYRECNLYAGDRSDGSPLWAEVWTDASWRRSNFYVTDFRSWTVAVVPRIGVRVPAAAGLALMPYLTGELAVTGRTEHWQNRIVGGAGLRLMPFRRMGGDGAAILRGLRLYGEVLWVLGYVSGATDPGDPTRDVRFGVGWSLNRY